MKIRIPHENVKYRYRDFDLMMTINAAKNLLMEGKEAQTGVRNSIKLLFNGLIMVSIGLVLPMISSDIPTLLCNIFLCIGSLILVLDGAITFATYYSYRKTLEFGTLDADIVFDERGLHAWESPEKGFDASWESMTNCFITKRWIFILFKNGNLVVDLPYSRETKLKVIEGLKMGYKLSIIKFLSEEKGKLKVRNM